MQSMIESGLVLSFKALALKELKQCIYVMEDVQNKLLDWLRNSTGVG